MEGRENKSVIMVKCKHSHLASSGAVVKRCRDGGSSEELDHDREKKFKADDCMKLNLTKSRFKSMKSINGKKKVPLPNNMVGNQQRLTSVLIGRTNVSHSR